MWDTLRESSIGQIARLVFRRPDLFPYPEELESFQLPASLSATAAGTGSSSSSGAVLLNRKLLANKSNNQDGLTPCTDQSFFPSSTGTTTPYEEEKDLEAATVTAHEGGWKSSSTETPPARSGAPSTPTVAAAASTPVCDDDDGGGGDGTRKLGEEGDSDREGEAGGRIVVDWYDGADPSNPKNWTFAKKIGITTLMGLYTFAVYVGSSLYAPSQAMVMAAFGASYEAAALGIALYVVGYGLGPLLWSPLSEIPSIGRTNIYIVTFFVFVWLALGASVVDSFAGLLVLRFLLGFFGSPCLATAGATLDDMFAPWKLPYVLTVWSSSATLGPALGPIVSGFAVSKMGWRWGGWELFWLSAPVWVLMFLGLPETNPDAILHRKAARLRARTGRADLLCEADLKRAHMTPRQIAVDALIKPWQINALDPAVLYTTVYAAVLYGAYYSFFEAFPFVFVDMHGFNLGESGLPFLAFVPGQMIAVPGYIIWFRLKAEPVMRKELPPLYGFPESRLLPAVITTFLGPIGLFTFGKSGFLFLSFLSRAVCQCMLKSEAHKH